jgi:hypothetical protein
VIRDAKGHRLHHLQQGRRSLDGPLAATCCSTRCTVPTPHHIPPASRPSALRVRQLAAPGCAARCPARPAGVVVWTQRSTDLGCNSAGRQLCNDGLCNLRVYVAPGVLVLFLSYYRAGDALRDAALLTSANAEIRDCSNRALAQLVARCPGTRGYGRIGGFVGTG